MGAPRLCWSGPLIGRDTPLPAGRPKNSKWAKAKKRLHTSLPVSPIWNHRRNPTAHRSDTVLDCWLEHQQRQKDVEKGSAAQSATRPKSEGTSHGALTLLALFSPSCRHHHCHVLHAWCAYRGESAYLENSASVSRPSTHTHTHTLSLSLQRVTWSTTGLMETCITLRLRHSFMCSR